MTLRTLAASAVIGVLATAFVAGSVAPAEAGNRHGFFFHKRPIIVFGVGRYISGGGSCYWLKQKALRFDSSYWWNRYYNCRDNRFY